MLSHQQAALLYASRGRYRYPGELPPAMCHPPAPGHESHLTTRLNSVSASMARTAMSTEEIVALQTQLKSMAESLEMRIKRGAPEMCEPSPFRLIEGTDLLAMIVNHLSPADAMATAFVCRKFRDAIFAQYPLPNEIYLKRFDARAIHESGHVSSVARLAWARSLGGFSHLQDPELCNEAARGGFLETLQEARRLGYAWGAATCAAAAMHGHMHILEWLRHTLPPAERCPWTEGTCAAAASHGHLEVLRWCRKRKCKWDWRTCSDAARGGHLEVLKWARKNSCPWHEGTADEAVEMGHGERPKHMRSPREHAIIIHTHALPSSAHLSPYPSPPH